ncbi:hypothetical protein ACP275_04G143500 [Erythranthe tilingii]
MKLQFKKISLHSFFPAPFHRHHQTILPIVQPILPTTYLNAAATSTTIGAPEFIGIFIKSEFKCKSPTLGSEVLGFLQHRERRGPRFDFQQGRPNPRDRERRDQIPDPIFFFFLFRILGFWNKEDSPIYTGAES